MRLTASCAATLGRALAKRGSHPHGPTTPTWNQVAWAGQGNKHREDRRNPSRPWRRGHGGSFTGGGKDVELTSGAVCFRVWGKMMKARRCDRISSFTTFRAHRNLDKDGLKVLLPWNNEGFGEKLRIALPLWWVKFYSSKSTKVLYANFHEVPRVLALKNIDPCDCWTH